MLKDENIIVFSFADWESVPGSPQHISSEFAKENKVLFIETFGSRMPSLGRDHLKRIAARLLGWSKGIGKQGSGEKKLYIYSPIALMINAKPILAINRLVFLRVLKNLIKKLDMGNPILYFYLPPPPGVIDKLQKKAVIYDCADEWLTFPGGRNKTFLDAEKELMRKADLVFAANSVLYEKKRPYADNIHKIYHGVDYEHFAKALAEDLPLPEDIRQIKKPILGIVGTFADWMDLDLIKAVARRHREWSIISIGPVESNVKIRELTAMDNVHFLGRKNYGELPNYYKVIDVFIVPFRLTEHIKTCAPIRLYEHLSSGKPIIAADFPAAREIGKGLIDIAETEEDFIKKIEAALREDASLAERRRLLVKENTWEARGEERSGLIAGIINKKGGRVKRKIKVLYLITRLNIGGAEDVALSTAKSLDENRFEVTFASGPQNFSREMADKWRIDVTIIPGLVREINPLKDLIAFVRLYLFIKKNKFDIVHTHTSKAGILGRIAAKLAGVPVIFNTPHGGIFHSVFGGPKTIFLLSQIENFVTSFTDKVITCSENEKNDFLKHKIGREDKYTTIYWGLKQDDFFETYDIRAKRRELGLPEDSLVVGTIARLVPQKGHQLCLEAFKIAAKKVPGMKLLIVGDGVLRKDIEAKINELELSDKVIMTGFRSDIPQILACLDISLHTSIWEGTPIAVIEAMLMAKAIVTTGVGGIPELIEDGKTGLLIPAGDKQGLAEAIIRLINDKSLRENIGRAARQYAKERLTLESMITETTRLYEDFIKAKIRQ